MRRTVMTMGMLAALLASTAGLSLANGRDDSRADWRSNDSQCRTGTSVGVRFDSGWSSGGFGWNQGHRGQYVRHDRRFDRSGGWQSGRGNDRRFDDRNDRGAWNGRGGFDGRDGANGHGGYDGRDGANGHGGFDGRDGDARRPTPMPDRNDGNGRGW